MEVTKEQMLRHHDRLVQLLEHPGHPDQKVHGGRGVGKGGAKLFGMKRVSSILKKERAEFASKHGISISALEKRLAAAKKSRKGKGGSLPIKIQHVSYASGKAELAKDRGGGVKGRVVNLKKSMIVCPGRKIR
jgi:hypothetical protein